LFIGRGYNNSKSKIVFIFYDGCESILRVDLIIYRNKKLLFCNIQIERKTGDHNNTVIDIGYEYIHTFINIKVEKSLNNFFEKGFHNEN